jgi:hypothetical protein
MLTLLDMSSQMIDAPVFILAMITLVRLDGRRFFHHLSWFTILTVILEHDGVGRRFSLHHGSISVSGSNINGHKSRSAVMN